MSHGLDREYDLLLAAATQISEGFCMSCPTHSATVRHWSKTRSGKNQFVVRHRPRCRVTRSRLARLHADRFVHDLLELYNVLVGDYNEGDLVRHIKLVVL